MTPYLEQRVKRTPGCWEWTGPLTPSGYGVASIKNRRHSAHRAVYAALVGPIPDGLHVDHMCHNEDTSCPGGKTCRHRRCVNPSHLRAVTPRVNVTNGRGAPAVNLLKETCPQGHPYDYTDPRGWRKCTTCTKESGVTWRRAKGVRPSRAGAPDCTRGHVYTEATTRWSRGKRHCKTCDHERMVAASKLKVKPCRGCGGPKESGRAFAYCTTCRPRSAVGRYLDEPPERAE